MRYRELITKDYPDNAIVVDWKISPENLMAEVHAKIHKFNLEVIQYKTNNDSYCFVIAKR